MGKATGDLKHVLFLPRPFEASHAFRGLNSRRVTRCQSTKTHSKRRFAGGRAGSPSSLHGQATRMHGMTVSAFSSVSRQIRRSCWCARTSASTTHSVIEEGGDLRGQHPRRASAGRLEPVCFVQATKIRACDRVSLDAKERTERRSSTTHWRRLECKVQERTPRGQPHDLHRAGRSGAPLGLRAAALLPGAATVRFTTTAEKSRRDAYASDNPRRLRVR